jgi:hypothetical protein
MNSETILSSPQFIEFKQKAHDSLYEAIMKKIKAECENSFIQIAMLKYKKQEVGNSAAGNRHSKSSEGDDMSLESELMAPK